MGHVFPLYHKQRDMGWDMSSRYIINKADIRNRWVFVQIIVTNKLDNSVNYCCDKSSFEDFWKDVRCKG